GTPAIITATGLILNDKPTIKKGLLTGSSIVVNELLTLSLKYSIRRTRPYKTYPDIDNQAEESDASFPSGHTSNSFALATSLTMDFPKWYVIVPSYLWAGSVGYSRMHLGVHYPTDVLAGALIGTGSAILCRVVTKRFLNRVKRIDLQKE
ncbi:MAG: phosphatase PAP2 family protein, partial [Opitutaceae bacterium]|nr:phosphatase PAP2 family protein [Cytophagales bacterium]